MTTKIRFAQLYAAHAAFNRYAAIIVSKTTRGGDNLLREQGAAILIAKESLKEPFAERQNRSDFLIIAENRVQSGGSSLPHSSQDAAIIISKSSKNNNYAGELNFFVKSQNEYCTAFVEYVFSAWARKLNTATNPDYARSPLLCGQTSENNRM